MARCTLAEGHHDAIVRAWAAFGKIAGSATRRFAVDAPQADRAKRGKGGASSRAQRTIVTDWARRIDERLDVCLPLDDSTGGSRQATHSGIPRGWVARRKADVLLTFDIIQ